MAEHEPLIPRHGGYRRLKSFQTAQLVYDLTVRFCSLYINRRSRTRDQMVQAARSGVQNIAEGSQASATSRKTELKLTNVARASLEELRLDYEDFLRQRGLVLLAHDHPILVRFKKRRCATLEDVRRWVVEERQKSTGNHEPAPAGTGQALPDADKHRQILPDTDRHGPAPTGTDYPTAAASSLPVGESPCSSVSPVPPSPISSSALVANAALSLLNLACYLLDRQIARQAKDFENEGGFTERLYRVRSARRRTKR
jgi:four helix bundle suffix protein